MCTSTYNCTVCTVPKQCTYTNEKNMYDSTINAAMIVKHKSDYRDKKTIGSLVVKNLPTS